MAATFKDNHIIKTAIDNIFTHQSCIQRYNKNHVLITESINLAVVFDLKNLSWLKSWTFTNLSPLSSPMVYDALSDQFIAIKNYQTIRLFKYEDDTEDSKTIKLNKNDKIKCVLTSEKTSPIVLFSNGEIDLLSNVCENATSENHIDRQRVSLLEIGQDIERVEVVDTQSEANKLKFWLKLKSKTSKVFNLYNFDFQLNQAFQVYSIIEPENNFLTCIPPNGNFLLSISEDFKVQIVDANSSENWFELSLNKKTDTIINFKCLNLQNDSNAFVILCKNNQENNYQLHVYDLAYKLEIKKYSLTFTPIENSLISVDSNLFILSKSSMAYFPLVSEEISLVDLITNSFKQVNKEETNTVDVIKAFESEIKSIENEYLLVEALVQFCNKNNKKQRYITQLKSIIFSRRFNHQFMVNELKSRHFSREFLLEVFQMLTKSFVKDNENVLNVIDWLLAFLDSYFTCLNSSVNQGIVQTLSELNILNDEMINACKGEKEVKYLIETILCALEKDKRKRKIHLPTKQHLGYTLDEIYL